MRQSKILQFFNAFTLLFILLLTPFLLLAQNKGVSGTVTDENGQGMPGVSIVLEGTTRGVQTDVDGKYSIQAGTGDVLKYSFIGYKKFRSSSR